MLIEEYEENYVSGWVKLFRSFSKWEWYKNSKMVHLFLHLLINANHKDMKWQGQTIKRGQLITGLYSLNRQTNISVQSIRTCLSKLKSTNEITIKTSNKNSLITIINYDLYQSLELTNNQTNKQLTNNQQTTNNKQELKELKNEKNIPDLSEFLRYAKTIKIYHSSFDFQLETKYEAWKINDWKDGYNKPIKNWKNKLKSSMAHFRIEYTTQQKPLKII